MASLSLATRSLLLFPYVHRFEKGQMNCFAHGFRFLDDPYKVVGTALPDWLCLIDRKVRVRERSAAALVGDEDGVTSRVAAGIVQHHLDDRWFHEQVEFVQLNLELALELRSHLGSSAGYRPHFAAHVMIEMLLDAALGSRHPDLFDRYYGLVSQVDPRRIEGVVNRIASRTTDQLARFIPGFVAEGYLYDYFYDSGVLYRMNRILKRVKLAPLPDSVLGWLPSVRERVYGAAGSLLEPLWAEGVPS